MSKTKGLIQEFKEFISQGSALDLAVGIIIGAAFTAIVNSLVNDLIMPLVGLVLGGHNISELSIKVGNVGIQYGLFLQNIVNFFLIAVVVFFIIKGINIFRKNNEAPQEEVASEEIELLREIRDSLKK